MQRENNHMIKCSTPFLIKELQIKKKKNEILVVLEWLKSQTLKTSNCFKDAEQHELTRIDGGNANGTAILGEYLVILTKLNTILIYDPALVVLDFYPDELKTYLHTKIFI